MLRFKIVGIGCSPMPIQCRTFVLSFIGPDLVGGSVPDGHYTLEIPATSVSNSLGSLLTNDFSSSLQRFQNKPTQNTI